MSDDLSRSFGCKEVSVEERRRRIRLVFDNVARRYDLMNDFMSFGVHRLWKKSLVRLTQRYPGDQIVDLAGGTGDIARLLAKKRASRTTVVDASLEMMLVGRKSTDHLIDWVCAEGEALPIGSNSLDLVTVSFGLRNMTSPTKALVEVLRCLKPSGGFVCLEFSRPQSWFRPFYDLYSFIVIPRLGSMIAGEPRAYQYLIESIRRFPEQRDLERLMTNAGFENVGYRNLMFGVACLHWGEKGMEQEESARSEMLN
ncbi:MAG: class I SAM-dependent methyltransferase [bacterium]|nr:class I SAM-dependent methyltransferase [bacterium]